MKLITSITKNISSMGFVQVWNRILAIFVGIYIIRYFSKLDYGLYASASAIVFLFLSLNQFGLKQISVLDIAKDKSLASKYLLNSLVIRIFVIIILSLMAIVYTSIVNQNQQILKLLILLLCVNFMDSISDHFTIIYYSFERMEFKSLSLFIFGIVNFLTVFLSIKFFSINIYHYVIINIVLSSFPVFFDIFILKKYFKIKMSFIFDLKFSKYLIIAGLPFLSAGIGWALFEYTDKTMLSKMTGPIAVGEYAVAKHITNIFRTTFFIYFGALYPVLARLFGDSKDKFIIIINKTFLYLSIVTFLFFFILFLGADKLVILLFKEKYIASVPIVQILAITFINNLFYQTFVIWYTTSSKQKLAAKIVLTGALINVVLNYFMIMKWNAVGAAWATVISNVYMTTFYLVHLSVYNKKYSIFILIKQIYKPVISFIFGMILYFFIKDQFNVVISISISILTYISLLFVFKTFGSFEKKLVYDFLSDIKKIKKKN